MPSLHFLKIEVSDQPKHSCLSTTITWNRVFILITTRPEYLEQKSNFVPVSYVERKPCCILYCNYTKLSNRFHLEDTGSRPNRVRCLDTINCDHFVSIKLFTHDTKTCTLDIYKYSLINLQNLPRQFPVQTSNVFVLVSHVAEVSLTFLRLLAFIVEVVTHKDRWHQCSNRLDASLDNTRNLQNFTCYIYAGV